MFCCELQTRPSGDGTASVLTVSGALTIDHAEEARQALLEALDRTPRLALDCREVTAIDLTGLQLLCSAHRTAARGRRQLTLAHPFPPALLEAIADSGFTRLRPCHSVPAGTRCLWQDPGAEPC